jgi:hypothetical protein
MDGYAPSNEHMLNVMANENMDEWSADADVCPERAWKRMRVATLIWRSHQIWPGVSAMPGANASLRACITMRAATSGEVKDGISTRAAARNLWTTDYRLRRHRTNLQGGQSARTRWCF